MGPKEIRERAEKLAKRIGSKALVSVSLSTDYVGELVAAIYPDGILSKHAVHVHTKDKEGFEGLFDKLETEWAAHAVLHRDNTIKAMALKIIEITDDRGFCSEGALRMHFDQSMIDNFGSDAIEAANRMADRGPFAIQRLSGANAA